jgi:structural maintenance of chromosome 4
LFETYGGGREACAGAQVRHDTRSGNDYSLIPRFPPRSQSKPDAGDIARISALEKEIAAATAQLEELQEKSSAIEKAIKDLEKKILEIGGAKLLTQKSKVDGIRLHINLANDEITKAEVAKAKAEKDSVKYDATIETNRASLDEVEGELGELTGQLKECVQYVTELRSQVEAAQSAAEHSKDDLESLKSELDTKTEEIQAFRQKEVKTIICPYVYAYADNCLLSLDGASTVPQ